jgi:DNA polymerase III delta subunit
MAAAGKRSYRDHAPALKALTGAKALPPVVLVYGKSEYLLGESVRVLRAKAAAAGAVTQACEAPALTEATVAALGGQASLFEPATLFLVRRVETAKSLPKLLALLPAGGPRANLLLLVLASDNVPAPLKAELDRLGAALVPCVDPWPSEAPQALAAVAESLGLKLRPDAVQLLLAAHGVDLVKQHNELARVALALGASATAAPLSAEALAPHLGMLREDEAFQLDKLLLARQWAKAQALASALLARGEKPLALLGILASHCRTAIRVAEGAEVRLPPFVLKGFEQAIRRGTPTEKYQRALAICQETDLKLKSSRVSEELLLGRVLAALSV